MDREEIALVVERVMRVVSPCGTTYYKNSLQKLRTRLREMGYEMIFIDTDSIFIRPLKQETLKC